MSAERRPGAARLARAIEAPPGDPTEAPDAMAILCGCEEPPPFPEGNVFPIEWRTETPKLWDLYDESRDPGWTPNRLPWETLRPEVFTLDQRYALAYWFALLLVFDSSGPAVFARAMIHTYETHAEDPLRKCFFSITRDEVNHEEVCQRAIQTLTPGGPLDYAPETAPDAGLGILALAERRDNWRAAVLKLKGVLDPHGVEFPRIPETGIDGKTVAFDPEDVIPVFRPPPRREPPFALRPMPARRRRSRGCFPKCLAAHP